MSTIETESAPFAGGGLTWHEPTAMEDLVAANFRLTSPFAGGFTGEEESESAFSDVEALIGELEDEGFRESVDSLVDEVAGRHLEAISRWPDTQEAENAAAAEASAWMESFADAVDSRLAELEALYDTRRVDSFTDREADTLLAEFARDPDSASEQFLGGLVKKAVNVAKSVAKGAVSGLTRLIPMGPVFGLLRKLVGPLLKRVLAKAINRLPAPLRAPATQLATKFGLGEQETGEAEDLAEEFDTEFATLLLAPSDAAATELLFEVEQDSVPSREDPIAALDRARATLSRQLAEAEQGRPPTEQLEQFIPAVMAAMPLIRTGVKVVGRARIKDFLARLLATMIQGYVGPQAARALAPHIADTGLRLLSLEAESSEELGSEALVSTLEEAITQVMAIPTESLDDPLRLEAEVQEALASAAVHYLPRELLRDDLEGYDTEGGTGPWVAMPRSGRARRYRKSMRRYDVAITRPQASSIELPGADTLEERLLDAGVSSWPVTAEVQLFESMIGTHLGHLAAGEGEDVSVSEFEELSPVNAALLLGRPALGSRAAGAAPVARRFFRVVVPGRKVIRRRSPVLVRLRAKQPQPELRMHVRLGERLAHQVAGLAARNAQPELVALLGRILGPRVQESVATRLSRMLGRVAKAAVPAARGQQLSAHLTEAVKAEFAKQLPQTSEALSAAAKDAAPGLTLTFAFPFADAAALAGGQPGTPTMTVRPGTQDD
ncbi:hypothetical protein [Agromyces bauzanensis]